MLERAWQIHGNNEAERMHCFLQLGLRHSMELFKLIDVKEDICEKYLDTESFWKYNRQHQMLYYGDLSYNNDANVHPLKPGVDVVYSGFDFHDCFNSLYEKIRTDRDQQLYKYHLFTLCDLINHRIDEEYLTDKTELPNDALCNTFFYREKDSDRSRKVLEQMSTIIQAAISDPKIGNHPFIEKCQDMIARYREMRHVEQNCACKKSEEAKVE